VRLGDRGTRALYVVLVGVPFAAAAALAVTSRWPLLALLAVPAAAPPLRVIRSGATGLRLLPVLRDTGRLELAYAALLAVGLALAG
jgi:1,4-dihydroxy-2-naphthoate polyprenyltransferase